MVFAVFTALKCATTVDGHLTTLARAAADVLATLRFDSPPMPSAGIERSSVQSPQTLRTCRRRGTRKPLPRR